MKALTVPIAFPFLCRTVEVCFMSLGMSIFLRLRLTSSGFEDSGDEVDCSSAPYHLMEKRSLEKSILLVLELEHHLKIQEEVRSKLSSLELCHQNEIQRTISAFARLQKYAESRKEIDRRLDVQFQRKIAEVLDKHLSMVQRDHGQKSQIVERRIRDDAAVEEAKREQSMKEEKVNQERTRKEAEARQKAAGKLAAEAQKAAYEGAAILRVETVSTSSQISQNSVSHATMVNNIGVKSELPGIKVFADSIALEAELRRRALHDQVSSNIYLSKEYSQYGRQIGNSIGKLTPTTDSVKARASELIEALDGQDCPHPIACRLFADKIKGLDGDMMISIVKSRNTKDKTFGPLAFACGYVMLLVTNQVPDAMDYLLAEFHKVCMYTVPKHLHALNAAVGKGVRSPASVQVGEPVKESDARLRQFFQVRQSGSEERVAQSIMCQSCWYCPISWMPTVPWMSCAYWLAWSPSATVLNLRRRSGMRAYRSGVISWMERPPMHRSSQKRTCMAFPTYMVVEAKNNARSSAVNCKSRPAHALVLSVRLNQSQRRGERWTLPRQLATGQKQFDAQARNSDYYRLIGYQEEVEKSQSTESYLVNVVAYVKLYAAMIQTEIKGVRHPHGLAEGWKWLAMFLNTLPAITATAFALHAFLKMAGFALHKKYGSQFMKILDVISRRFIPALKEQGMKVQAEAISNLQNYLKDKVYLEEPEGRYLSQHLLSKVFMCEDQHRMATSAPVSSRE
ncbi:unnamed protein product [Triticum turgidum subsp. durum]|uniref:mRNA export factor GLE1 n=1 Tax=Triticum turgidum subsp. durum TaxID=4567 RepID=A0A9R0UU95_TRITD|nr:unnamed protein product [Triticum turgidum subsp. durum]